MNSRRDTARRWVDDGKSDEEIAHLIVIGYDERPARLEMEQYVNEARAESRQRPGTRAKGGRPPLQEADVRPRYDKAVAAIRARDQRPTDEEIAKELSVGPSTIRDWRRKGLVPQK